MKIDTDEAAEKLPHTLSQYTCLKNNNKKTEWGEKSDVLAEQWLMDAKRLWNPINKFEPETKALGRDLPQKKSAFGFDQLAIHHSESTVKSVMFTWDQRFYSGKTRGERGKALGRTIFPRTINGGS